MIIEKVPAARNKTYKQETAQAEGLACRGEDPEDKGGALAALLQCAG